MTTVRALVTALWIGSAALVFAGPVLALDIVVTDAFGQKYDLSKYRGKWIIVSYWASWCPNCLKEVPELNAFYMHNRTRAIVFGVNWDEQLGRPELHHAIARMGIKYPTVNDSSAFTPHLGAVQAVPTTFVIDPLGHVVASDTGLVTRTDLERFIHDHERFR